MPLLDPGTRVTPTQDTFHITRALSGAREAALRGDRAFGTVIAYKDGRYLTAAFGTETATDPTRHCEVVAIREACAMLGGLLSGCTIYSTHEPCPMCCGAIRHSKLSRVVYGSRRVDLPELFRRNQFGLYDLLGDTTVPPKIERFPEHLRLEAVDLFSSELEAKRQLDERTS